MAILIAELSSNHGGDLDLAKRFIDDFAAAGVDYCKVQTTRAARMSPTDPQYDWFVQAELDDEAHDTLATHCREVGVKFLTTVYHPDDVPLCAVLGMDAIKIGSGEARDLELARAVAGIWPRVYVSLGITQDAMKTPFRKHVKEARFLRCITRYPAPTVASVIKAMQQYGERITGWSDHTVGLEACEAAVLAGAEVIEVHVQRPDQARPVKAFEKTVEDVKRLKAFMQDDPQRFVGRWRSRAGAR